jgi:hypothetical protein
MSNSVCTSLTTKYNHRYASVDKTSSVEEDEEKKNIHQANEEAIGPKHPKQELLPKGEPKIKGNLKLHHTWLAES